jgi:preprotein translocase subunit SecG
MRSQLRREIQITDWAILMGIIFGTLLTVLAIFLILLVLVQRGRGGGLTGALGGMGGSSAFGAKAGDVFTRITIVTAAIWICVCATAFYWANHRGDRLGSINTSTTTVPESGMTAPATATPGTTEGTAAPAGDATKSAEPAAPPAAATESAAPATPPAADPPAPAATQ